MIDQFKSLINNIDTFLHFNTACKIVKYNNCIDSNINYQFTITNLSKSVSLKIELGVVDEIYFLNIIDISAICNKDNFINHLNNFNINYSTNAQLAGAFIVVNTNSDNNRLQFVTHDFNEFSRIINEELFNFNNIDTKEINNLFLTDNKSYTLIPIITGLCSIIGAIICIILIKNHKGD